jgi:hypothetical protein
LNAPIKKMSAKTVFSQLHRRLKTKIFFVIACSRESPVVTSTFYANFKAKPANQLILCGWQSTCRFCLSDGQKQVPDFLLAHTHSNWHRVAAAAISMKGGDTTNKSTPELPDLYRELR